MRLSIFVAPIVLASACSRGAEKASSGRPADTVAAANAPAAPGAGNAGRNAASNSYVGVAYDSLPRGVTYKGGSLAGNLDFAEVATPSGNMIWLDTIVAATRKPARKVVRAELSIPPLASDERVFMASCDVNGKLDPLVVAIVVAEPNVSRYTKVRQAWRANAVAARFDVIPIAGVTCEEG